MTDTLTKATKWPQFISDVPYSEHSSLNTLQICLPRQPNANDRYRLWIIYIHGGAWRDPAIDSSSFQSTQAHLLKASGIKDIAGLASINYRLSPYPSHPNDPSNPADPARNATHPDHINDLLAAILYLQEKYHFEDRYVLLGHSCGATLALQVAMKRYWGQQYESTFAYELNVIPPIGVIGVEGIYDILKLLEQYEDEPAYLDFILNAFGNDRKEWQAVSPARANFYKTWSQGQLIALIHSKDDELVGLEQRDAMQRSLEQQGWSDDGPQHLIVHELEGLKHDQVWQDGRLLSECVSKAIVKLLKR